MIIFGFGLHLFLLFYPQLCLFCIDIERKINTKPYTHQVRFSLIETCILIESSFLFYKDCSYVKLNVNINTRLDNCGEKQKRLNKKVSVFFCI